MRWLYDLGFSLFAVFSLPHFFSRLRQAEDPAELVRERLGGLSPEKKARLGTGPSLWIHGVSVGEVLAAEKLIGLLLKRRPDLHLVLSTVTPTGQRLAKRWAGERVSVVYFPFDFRFSVSRFFETVNPSALLLVETEIWPNVLREARRRCVPVGLVNGRISDRSFRAFRKFSGIFRPLLGGIDLFLVQTEEDRKRFVALGVEGLRVEVTGNMKLDALDLNGRIEDREALRRQWGFSTSDLVLIGGSTHAGEEEILLRTLHRLRGEFPSLKLLLAPRHIERAEKILKLAQRMGLRGALAQEKDVRETQGADVRVLNQLGVLRRLYGLADLVFMGGSLVRHGGQNPVEPARVSRALVHGPWIYNFGEIYETLDREGGGLAVPSEHELASVLRRLLASEKERNLIGTRAHEILRRLSGATEKNFQRIERLLSSQKQSAALGLKPDPAMNVGA